MLACLCRNTQLLRGNRVHLLRHGRAPRSKCTRRLRNHEGGQNDKQRADEAGRNCSSSKSKPIKLIYFLAIPWALRTLIANLKTASPRAREHVAASSLQGWNNSPAAPQVRHLSSEGYSISALSAQRITFARPWSNRGQSGTGVRAAISWQSGSRALNDVVQKSLMGYLLQVRYWTIFG